MSIEFSVKPLTRVEGHGNVIIRVDVKERALKEVELNIIESPRFFERLLVGVPAEEAPRIAERICGICYVAHHLASVKAVEAAWGVEVPEPATMLRKIINHAGVVTSHLLHIAFLCLPDLIDLKDRSVIELSKVNPGLVKKAVKILEFGNRVVQVVGGRVIHPVTAIPGGMAKPLSKELRDQLLSEGKSTLRIAEEFVSEVADLMERRMDLLSHPNKGSYYVAMVRNRFHELYDGEVVVINAEGERVYEFNPKNYLDYIDEEVSKHSFVKQPYLRKIGYPAGIYRVGPLARLNVCKDMDGELTRKYYELFIKCFGKPTNHLMAYNFSRLVELINCLEQLVALLESEKAFSSKVRGEVVAREGEGVGLVEAPRGILIHHYKTNGEGLITYANIIPPTTHNAPIIEDNLRELAQSELNDLIEGREDAKWRLEVMVRAYDPCISCATHLVRIVRE